jgi:hypothetical protein
MADVQDNSHDPELQALQGRWAPKWRIWRSRDGEDLRGWCATRRGQGREMSRTLMEPTAEALEKALVEQADRQPLYG